MPRLPSELTSLSPKRMHYWGLFLLGFLSYFFYLQSPYFFDDLEFIVQNPYLWSLTEVKQALFFSPQPTKPITNFIIALGHLLGQGLPFFQRLITLLFHCTNGLLLFSLCRKLFQEKAPFLACCATLVFLLHPLQTESLMVVQFRGEVLASFFLLLALHCRLFGFKHPASRLSTWGVPLWLILSALSKEVFLCIGPLMVIALDFQKSGPSKSVLSLKSLKKIQKSDAATFLGLVLVALFLIVNKDTGLYTYKGNVGWAVVGFDRYLEQLVRGWNDFFLKFFLLKPLTIIRLSYFEKGWKAIETWFQLGLGMTVVGWILLWWKKYPPLRFYLFWFFVGSFFYLVIPNANVGSEHYHYWAIAGWSVFLFHLLGKLKDGQKKIRFLNLYTLSALFLLVVALNQQARLYLYLKPQLFYQIQTQQFPHVVTSWLDLANYQMSQRTPLALKQAHQTLQQAKALQAHHPATRASEYMLSIYNQDLKKASLLLEALEKTPWPAPRMASFYFHFSMLGFLHKRCDLGKFALRRALELQPTHPEFLSMSQKVDSLTDDFCL